MIACRRFRLPMAFALGASCLLVAPNVSAGKPQPFTLGIQVGYTELHGEQDLRRQLEGTLLAELEQQGCFRQVRIVDAAPDIESEIDADIDSEMAGPDLLLQITISDLEEKSRFGVNIAQRSNPDRTPDIDQMVVVDTEASFDVTLRSGAGGETLRAKRFNETAEYRPRMNEDPRLASWDELIRSAARTTRRFLCRGSIEKDLQRASR